MMSDFCQIARNIFEFMLCKVRVHFAHQEHHVDLCLCCQGRSTDYRTIYRSLHSCLDKTGAFSDFSCWQAPQQSAAVCGTHFHEQYHIGDGTAH